MKIYNETKMNLSIRYTLIIVFLLAMLVSFSSIGSMVFANWYRSAGVTTEKIAATMNESIHNRIQSFLHEPVHVNAMNYPMLQNGIVNYRDEKERERFFVGVLMSQSEEIYSFSFGTAEGEYYGARRNRDNVIEIMRNNDDTGGNSWYYSVNEDWTAGERVLEAGLFDPRTREWYKVAVKTGSPSFSSVYKHFIMDDLSVSAARPVYGPDGDLLGVLGTHMLLSGIGDYLAETVRPYNGYSVIIEKDNGALIANSMGLNNFSVLQDGSTQRYSILDIMDSEVSMVYEQYTRERDPHFLFQGKSENHHINVKEINMGGLDWIVISAISEDLLLKDVTNTIRVTMLLAGAALLLLFVLYYGVTRKLTQPMYHLLHASEAFSSGDLRKRAPVVRNDEIGRMSNSFNKMADSMQNIIDNLEATVKERTEKLYDSSMILKEKTEQLQLILDSAGEGIYGNDREGNCTFCNLSGVRLLGYTREEDLLGKNMHKQIHHSKRNGEPFSVSECSIMQSIKEGVGIRVDDEVFWKADGTYIDVEYRSYPQIKDGEVVGSVISFSDISERKAKEKKIFYLSYHDTLTGLYNRRYFAENLSQLDTAEHLPLSVIFADINGLKMTNDIFGHGAGDALIKKSSEILTRSCRANDIIARMGGDEFIILLPKTDQEQAQKIIARIRSGFSKARVAAIKCSISIGTDTKTTMGQSIEDITANAENFMYKDKSINRKAINKDMIDTIMGTLHSENPEEKQHSEVVSRLCAEMGTALGLNDTELNKLKRASYLHDIGKIVLYGKELPKEVDMENLRQHSIVGYRILNLFDDTLDLAEYVYYHHERWDGKGYPTGLKGEEIPLISRIISIAEIYERNLRRETGFGSGDRDKALQAIKDEAGKRFDPQIVKLFIKMMEAKHESET